MRNSFASGVLTHGCLRARDVLVYALCEDLTTALLCFMLVFSPWAFGTTEAWSIWTMNACGYCVGILLAIKIWIRHMKINSLAPYGVRRCCAALDEDATLPNLPERILLLLRQSAATTAHSKGRNREVFAPLLAAITGLLLLYCLVSAVNAGASVESTSGRIVYRHCLNWLPHSLDSMSSWQTFLRYLALACSFWAAQDWIRERALNQHSPRASKSGERLKRRINCLLWLLTISGGLLALEGILQRAADSPKLLFLVTPQLHQDPVTQFASYAYRANAGQYLNLLWPVCFGFWWTDYRARPNRVNLRRVCQLSCVVLMVVAPFVSLARGAALVDLAMLVILFIGCFVWTLVRNDTRKGADRPPIIPVLAALVGIVLLQAAFGWKELGPRMQHALVDLQDREELYQTAQLIVRDYPAFGSGPGTFSSVYQLYRRSTEAYWPAQLHNDWLEIRLTFGWVGAGLLILGLVVFMIGTMTPRILCQPLVWCLGLALTGCLVQARWDFPLQVYSIAFLLVVWCAVLFALSAESSS